MLAASRFVRCLFLLSACTLLASPAWAQSDALTEDQTQRITQYANDFLGNASLTSPADARLTLKSEGTIEFWIDPLWDSPLEGDSYVLACTADGKTLYSVFFREAGEQVQLGIDVGDGKPRMATVAIVPDGSDWYHVAIVVSAQRGSTGAKIYVDGASKKVFADAKFVTPKGVSSAPRLTIGAAGPDPASLPEGKSGYLKASIAGLRVWNRAVDKNDLQKWRFPGADSILSGVLFPPHPQIANLIAYSDFETALGKFDVGIFDPIAGFWVEQNASTRRKEKPNQFPLASQYETIFPPMYYVVPFREQFFLYEDGVYAGRITSSQAKSYSVELANGSGTFQLVVQEDGSLKCARLPMVFARQKAGDVLVLKRATPRMKDRATEGLIRQWDTSATLSRFDSVIQHYTTVLLPYDITDMDPFNYLADRGVENTEARVFEDVKSDSDSDVLKRVPLNMDLFWIGETNAEETNQFYSSAMDISQAYSASLGFSVKVPVVDALGANASFSQSQRNMEQKDLTAFMRTGKAEFFALALNRQRATLTREFKDALRTLASDGNYDQFFRNWGTHYCAATTLGGLQVMTSLIERSEYVKGVSQEWEAGVSVGTKEKGSKGSGEASAGSKMSNEWKSVVENGTWTIRQLGGTSIPGQKMDSVQLDDNHTAPINLDLRPYYELLSPQYFPNEPEIYLGLRKKLRDAIWNYVRNQAQYRPQTAVKKKVMEVGVTSVSYKDDGPFIWSSRTSYKLKGHVLFHTPPQFWPVSPVKEGTLPSDEDTLYGSDVIDKGYAMYAALVNSPMDVPWGGSVQMTSRSNKRTYVIPDDGQPFYVLIDSWWQLQGSGTYGGMNLNSDRAALYDNYPGQASDFPVAPLGQEATTPMSHSGSCDLGFGSSANGTTVVTISHRQVPDIFTRIDYPADILDPRQENYMPSEQGPSIHNSWPAGADALVVYLPLDGHLCDLVRDVAWQYNTSIWGEANANPQTPLFMDGALTLAKDEQRPIGPIITPGIDYGNCTLHFDLFIDDSDDSEEAIQKGITANQYPIILYTGRGMSLAIARSALVVNLPQNTVAISKDLLIPGRWHKVIVSFDRASQTVSSVVDGQVQDPYPLPVAVDIEDNGQPRFTFQTFGGNAAAARIDEFAVFGRPLSMPEMQQLATRTRRIGETPPVLAPEDPAIKKWLDKHPWPGQQPTIDPADQVVEKKPIEVNPNHLHDHRDVPDPTALLAYFSFDGGLTNDYSGVGIMGLSFYADHEGTFTDDAIQINGQQFQGYIEHPYFDFKDFALRFDFADEKKPTEIMHFGTTAVWFKISLAEVGGKTVGVLEGVGTPAGWSQQFAIPRRAKSKWNSLVCSVNVAAKTIDMVVNGKKTVINLPDGFAFGPASEDAQSRQQFPEPRFYAFTGTNPCLVDEFMIFSRALTDEEITALSNRPRINPTPGGTLVGPGHDGPQPDDSQPDDSQPDDSQPDDSQPDDSQPDDSQPDDSQPDDAEPDVTPADPGETHQWAQKPRDGRTPRPIAGRFVKLTKETRTINSTNPKTKKPTTTKVEVQFVEIVGVPSGVRTKLQLDWLTDADRAYALQLAGKSSGGATPVKPSPSPDEPEDPSEDDEPDDTTPDDADVNPPDEEPDVEPTPIKPKPRPVTPIKPRPRRPDPVVPPDDEPSDEDSADDGSEDDGSMPDDGSEDDGSGEDGSAPDDGSDDDGSGGDALTDELLDQFGDELDDDVLDAVSSRKWRLKPVNGQSQRAKVGRFYRLIRGGGSEPVINPRTGKPVKKNGKTVMQPGAGYTHLEIQSDDGTRSRIALSALNSEDKQLALELGRMLKQALRELEDMDFEE